MPAWPRRPSRPSNGSRGNQFHGIERSRMVFLVLLGVFAGTMALCIGTWAYLNQSRLVPSLRVQADRGEDPLAAADERPATVLRDTTASDLEVLDRLLSRTS